MAGRMRRLHHRGAGRMRPHPFAAVDEALAELTDHHLHDSRPENGTAEMATRLVRWLAGDPEPAGSLREHVDRHVRDGGSSLSEGHSEISAGGRLTEVRYWSCGKTARPLGAPFTPSAPKDRRHVGRAGPMSFRGGGSP